MIFCTLGQLTLSESVLMILPLIVALWFGEIKTAASFLVAIGLSLIIGLGLYKLCKTENKVIYAKEGFIIVAFGWLIMSIIGALPFVLSGDIPSYIDAFFETVSGFTTTGASILSDVEALSRGMLYWRSFSHWVGGMGVLVFLLALSPSGKKNEGFTMHLFRAESPGPEVGKLVPKLRQTAIYLYCTYMVLSVLNFAFLMLGDMNWFEALCTMFGTAGTGGFGVKN